jgi:hypothetical protein
MFQALLAHLQEALNKQHLVYWYSVVCAAHPKDEKVMLETCRGP